MYGKCVETLSEYRRATHNRVKARIDNQPDTDREELRQQAYSANAKARAAIGEAAIVSGTATTVDGLEAVRVRIGDLNTVDDMGQLTERTAELDKQLELALGDVRGGLTAR